MAVEIKPFRKPGSRTARYWRRLLAAVVAAAVGCGSMVYAANQSVQGAKKEEGGFEGDAPTAILIEASSGSTALRLLEADAGVDLLIADFAMPEMSGTELFERVRTKYPAIRSVFITGYSEKQLSEMFASEIVITKPFSTEQLTRAVEKAMGES